MFSASRLRLYRKLALTLLVIPQREIPRVIHEILDAVHELTEVHREAPEGEIFQVLMESRRLPSVQDQLGALRKRFLIVSR